MTLSGEALESLYSTMVRIRRFDERTVELFNQGLVKGTAHSYVGQEAVAAGACAALEDGDSIVGNHRGHGHCIAKGARVDLMMAELMGKVDGYCRGLGGSMHIAALDRIIGLDPAVIVPGHGPLCGLEGPREMRAYLEYVRREAKPCFEQGLSLLEASKRIDLGPYASWTEPDRIVFNVARAYRELRGEPFDAPINIAEIFGTMFALRQSRGKA